MFLSIFKADLGECKYLETAKAVSIAWPLHGRMHVGVQDGGVNDQPLFAEINSPPAGR